ncbi:phytanoyl-CoA dioxygenase family protein [Saccharothrix algeriensis]|uniref:Phytanoyl-CoA dioxygenase family protein n=1 Tax=Saccharothrix algeriensis TaxID=173560 RepID=A0A8T8HZW9_9PSEU|nr:phytanoyl-CoA dioxygenase family protein [Saccharothrix algeriensis]MBM7809804.1 hypothetical protein [Saccharothrix algeriensis]QTR04082.1 phytanoyl-CoA dioxygenase family protein [Saccharothrix algeriensis]
MREFDLAPARGAHAAPVEEARRALVEDGCLLLRGALPVPAVRRLRRELAGSYSRLTGESWDWARLRRSAADDDLLGLRRALFGCASNGALFRHRRLVSFLEGLLGAPPYLHPRRWLRLNPPGGGLGQWAVPYHQDYRFVQGTPDVVTVWLPLHRCHGGGIRVESRSHRRGLRPLGDRIPSNHLRPVAGVRQERVDEPACDMGDVVLFHSLTVHGTAPNTGSLNRISVDARFQRRDDPIAREQLRPAIAPQDGLPIGVPGATAEDPSAWSGDALADPAADMPLVPAGPFSADRLLTSSRFVPAG